LSARDGRNNSKAVKANDEEKKDEERGEEELAGLLYAV
jgi:hypothetical protein